MLLNETKHDKSAEQENKNIKKQTKNYKLSKT